MAKQTDHATVFAIQKPLAKSAVMKLQPGTLLELKWLDGPNSFGVLLAKPENEKGDVSLSVARFGKSGLIEHTDSHAVHSQVVATHGQLKLSIVNGKPTVMLT